MEDFSAIVSRNVMHLLKTFNLKLKFPDERKQIFVINGLEPECQEFTMLPFEIGLKLKFQPRSHIFAPKCKNIGPLWPIFSDF